MLHLYNISTQTNHRLCTQSFAGYVRLLASVLKKPGYKKRSVRLKHTTLKENAGGNREYYQGSNHKEDITEEFEIYLDCNWNPLQI